MGQADWAHNSTTNLTDESSAESDNSSEITDGRHALLPSALAKAHQDSLAHEVFKPADRLAARSLFYLLSSSILFLFFLFFSVSFFLFFSVVFFLFFACLPFSFCIYILSLFHRLLQLGALY